MLKSKLRWAHTLTHPHTHTCTHTHTHTRTHTCTHTHIHTHALPHIHTGGWSVPDWSGGGSSDTGLLHQHSYPGGHCSVWDSPDCRGYTGAGGDGQTSSGHAVLCILSSRTSGVVSWYLIIQLSWYTLSLPYLPGRQHISVYLILYISCCLIQELQVLQSRCEGVSDYHIPICSLISSPQNSLCGHISECICKTTTDFHV